ncbi:hypothetical protein [Microbacterium sp. Yaish 1]|uniref:hypothetical protein n=1 Tax=Microbacterium sp. Yaish 1 TaxID=2025014 RepID=UPI000B94430D|nr:hypothetical protein [Microbacterium sp. Yaish 1]OYC97231.1 hypothetical protein CI089_01370 [Microbacterium sp. Yaish 1]
MTDWPVTMKVGPIREWPGEFTRTRVVAPFNRNGRWEDGKRVGAGPVPLTVTLRDLDRELRELGAKDVELLIAVHPDRFRLDGRPYAGAKADHPGIILSFTIPNVGPVSYPCDTFTTWEGNLRAVTLALEALRKVDRYGVTKRGEQYRGFLALEATAAPAGFATAAEAHAWLIDLVGARDLPGTPQPALVLRKAQRITHPDMGGDAATFQRVSLAEAKIREAGLL